LSDRYSARGFSPCEFVLRMTRMEIGSHLGLKLETVSRMFSRFQEQGMVQVQGRLVKLLDPGCAASHARLTHSGTRVRLRGRERASYTCSPPATDPGPTIGKLSI
jgi:hypothetical protein